MGVRACRCEPSAASGLWCADVAPSRCVSRAPCGPPCYPLKHCTHAPGRTASVYADGRLHVHCICCGFPWHHVEALHAAREPLWRSLRTVLSYWCLLSQGSAAHHLSSKSKRGVTIETFIRWAVAGDANASLSDLCHVLCRLADPGRIVADMTSSAAVIGHPMTFLDEAHTTIGKALETIHVVRSAIRTQDHISKRILRLWGPTVPREVLLSELRRKQIILWKQRIVPAIAAYEDHQAAIAVLQHISGVVHQKLDRAVGPIPRQLRRLVLRKGYQAVGFRMLQQKLVNKRRVERTSCLFHVYPPWLNPQCCPRQTEPERHCTPVSVSFLHRSVGAMRGAIASLLARCRSHAGDEDVQSQGLEPPDVPALEVLFAAFRKRHAEAHVGMPDGCTPVDHTGPPLALVSILADLDAMVMSAQRGVTRLLHQLDQSRFYAAHLVGKHGLAQDPELHGLAEEEVYCLPPVEDVPPDVDDQMLSVLVGQELEGVRRALSCLPHAIAELLFCFGAIEFLSTAAAGVDSPVSLQCVLWEQETIFADWLSALREGESLLHTAAELIDDHRVTARTVLDGNADDSSALAEFLSDGLPSCAVSSVGDCVLFGTLAAAWSTRRSEYHSSVVAGGSSSSETVCERAEVGRSSGAGQPAECSPILAALLALDTFQLSAEGVARFGTHVWMR